LANALSKRGPIAARILAYLADRPDAADSARGIAEWWLGGEAALDVAAVESALEALAREGLVRADRLAHGTRVWRAGPALHAGAGRQAGRQQEQNGR
jgi:hypothetical protein